MCPPVFDYHPFLPPIEIGRTNSACLAVKRVRLTQAWNMEKKFEVKDKKSVLTNLFEFVVSVLPLFHPSLRFQIKHRRQARLDKNVREPSATGMVGLSCRSTAKLDEMIFQN